MSLAYGAVLVTLIHQVLNLLIVADGDSLSVRNRYFARKLPNLEILLPLLRFVHKQILQFLHVNFDDSNCYLKGKILIFVAFDPLEKFIGTNRYNASICPVAKLRVRFTGACLAVGKQGTVETTPGFLQHSCPQQIPHFLLVTVVV